MPVLPPEDDRRTSASARSCYDAGMPRGDNGAAAHARGQDLWQARRIDNGRVQSDALDTERRHRIRFFNLLYMQLLQTQTQLSQSLQEQFSCAQTQQNRILELLAPLPQIVQSVPLHINIARNAILEKIPADGCRCHGRCSNPSAIPQASNSTPLSKENAEPPFGARKRRRIGLDITHPDPNDPLVGRYQRQPIVVEPRQTHCEFTQKSGETPASDQPRRNTPRATVQTPNGGKSSNDTVPHGYLGSARSGYDNTNVLATKPPTSSRGIAPSLVPRVLTSEHALCVFQTNKFPACLQG